MLFSGYPVEAGAADSLAKPGRSVTGNSIYAATGVWGKLLEVLREIKPGIQRVGVLWTYVVPAFPREEIDPCYAELNAAANSLGIKLHYVEIAQTDQIRAALADIEREKPDALLLTSLFATDAGPTVVQFAVERALPAISDFDWTVATPSPHPLASYGPVYRELIRNATGAVNKILRGSKPGDIPIQQPSRFELIVNMKTAKASGVQVPEGVLLRADRLIE
jgi:putative ABC transport system substrate-binding protein